MRPVENLGLLAPVLGCHPHVYTGCLFLHLLELLVRQLLIVPHCVRGDNVELLLFLFFPMGFLQVGRLLVVMSKPLVQRPAFLMTKLLILVFPRIALLLLKSNRFGIHSEVAGFPLLFVLKDYFVGQLILLEELFFFGLGGLMNLSSNSTCGRRRCCRFMNLLCDGIFLG